MADIIKVTSKGQITLPSHLRKSLDITKDSFLAVDTVGDFIIMKTIGTALSEISQTFQKIARYKGITMDDIEEAIEESRQRGIG